GQRVLELGCGWGSLSLWMAARYPGARVLAVSNSRAQGRFIRARAAQRGLENLAVLTRDVNDFNLLEETWSEGRPVDRVVSVEMLEHTRNWAALLSRVAGWLTPGGRLFTHVFAHRRYAYPYEDRGPADWMARHFFTGGMMPSEDLLARVPSPLETVSRWTVDGTHYARTLEAWLRNLDDRARAPAIDAALRCAYGDDAPRWRQRWRVFMMACAELFAYADGREWLVSHRLMRARA
ncbi:MAG: class I SAM-dependent methyltransferase, partial [Myxococcales bacterium]|nr:class I SAM-dependent methyltransferase [Myxococcales bacterium]